MVSREQVAALVRRAQKGDSAAFDVLARSFARAAYSVALSCVGRPSDAEDVAQDAILAALERIDTCADPERFGAWLLRIARNRALNHLASRRLRDVPRDEPRELPAAPSAAARDESFSREDLVQALDALTSGQREVVLLHDLDGWSHAEIADALGTTEDASRQQLARARRALRERLERGR